MFKRNCISCGHGKYLGRAYIYYRHDEYLGRPCIVAEGLGGYSLKDTLECGQCFRHILLRGDRDAAYTESAAGKARVGDGDDGMCEYMVPIRGRMVFVGQRVPGELYFFDVDEDYFRRTLVHYFSLDMDYDKICDEIKRRTDSERLKEFCDMSRGVVLLRQEPWETLFSFIISQNNNIPRIRKIIRSICAAAGENLIHKSSCTACPVSGGKLCEDECARCGICYSFPSPERILSAPGVLSCAKVGFRYRYLMSAAEMVASGEISLRGIMDAGKYDYTMTELKRIVGVGDKVASCVALFGFSNYEAFPIDVWIKRAIDLYFDGKLDTSALGEYAGIAQQYIFHGIRNLELNSNK